MKISREEVLRVAKLANLDLSATEIDAYREQLDAILAYIDKLAQLDTANVEPMAQVLFSSADASASPAADSLRDDVVRPADVAEAILKQAPHAAPPYFRVPKVIDR
jgi:aspartyl-tRNA(Asn)/glutamyl-tRNA(Gln) amidotransferase subunit C